LQDRYKWIFLPVFGHKLHTGALAAILYTFITQTTPTH